MDSPDGTFSDPCAGQKAPAALGYTDPVTALSRKRLLPLLPAGEPDRPPPPRGASRRATPSGEWHVGFPFRLLLLLSVLPLLLLASAILVYREQQTDRVYAGVTALGVGLGRMTQEEAAQALKRHLVEESRRPLQLRYEDDAFSTSLATLGLRIDDAEVEQWAAQAWSIGRDTELRTWLRNQLVLMRRGYELPIALGFDRERATAALGRVAMEVERQPVNAGLAVEKAGERFEIHTSPARTGRRMNVPATLDRLHGALVNHIPREIDLVLDEALPAIGDADLAPAVTALGHMLGTPLELKDGARAWPLTPATAFSMLEISGLDAGQLPVTVRLGESKLRTFVEGVGREAEVAARNPAFDVQADRVIVRPGTAGKLADLNATLELLKERVVSPTRTMDVVFTEDRPWLTEADLAPGRDQANNLLNLPITLETPSLPGLTERRWTLDRTLLAQMLVLPNTQTVPREFRTLPPSQRPSFDIQLDSGKVTNFLAREVAPWVSEDPVDAQLQMRTVQVEVPNPAARQTAEGNPPNVPATIRESRPAVELRSGKEGRGPDYLGTFSGLQILFKNGSTIDPTERKVTLRLAPRPPRVTDGELTAARDLATRLIGEPVVLRWEGTSWTVTRDDLAGMLRYQNLGPTGPTGGPITAYLARDALLARAGAIARDVERHPQAPKDTAGKPRPVDVAATASALWIQASQVPANRTADVVLQEPEEVFPPDAPI